MQRGSFVRRSSAGPYAPGGVNPRDKRDRDRDREGGSGGGGRSRFIKKTCRFCADKTSFFDYKDAERLKRFLTEKGKIIPSRITGNCAKHQRVLARAVKKARHAAVVAFQIE